MAITTQTELASTVSNYLARDDLAAYVPDFVVLCEAKFNRIFRVEGNELTAILTPASDGTVALPSDYRELRALTAVSGGRAVEMVAPAVFEEDSERMRGGTPSIFRISARTLSVFPAGPVKLDYYRGVPPLASGPNWLILRDPDAYLYAVLAEACLFNKDPAAAQGWQAMAEGAVATIVDADKRARWSPARQTPTGWNP